MKKQPLSEQLLNKLCNHADLVQTGVNPDDALATVFGKTNAQAAKELSSCLDPSRARFRFWKGNRLDREYFLSLDDFLRLFIAWAKKKEPGWLEYYATQLHVFFIAEKDGLNSVADAADIEALGRLVLDEKWAYLRSVGIR
jgi:hypothetical protein